MADLILTADFIRSILKYYFDTGVFRWRERKDFGKRWNKRYAGRVAGNADIRCGGRITISIFKRKLFAHRLAFLYVMGRWPDCEIDHIDGTPSNNRWVNLREATSSQNKANKCRQINNKVGLKGVSWKADRKRWRAVIQVNGKYKHLGYFDDPVTAYTAYCAAAREYFGEFARAA